MLQSSKNIAAALQRDKATNRRLYKAKGKMGRSATLQGEGQQSVGKVEM